MSMSKLNLLICLFGIKLIFLPIDSSSQVHNYILMDSLSREPVAYATISAGSFIIYADQFGVFSTKDLPNDTIRISRLGYHSITLLKRELTPTIVLVPKEYSIKEFVVSGKAASFEIGYHKGNIIGFTLMKDFKAVFILSSKPKCKIEKVLVHTRNNRKGIKFIVSFFSVSDTGIPEDVIFTKEFISPSGKNLLEIPVDEANLVIPENGVFVAIKKKVIDGESDHSDDEGIVRLTKLYDKNVSFFHHQNRWFELQTPHSDYHSTHKIGLQLRAIE
jgi:hypothetical protein